MKKNSLLLCISLIIFVFSVLIGIFLNDVLSIVSNRNLILYYLSKATCIISLVIIIILSYRKKNLDNYLIQYTITIVYQLIPFFIRLLGGNENSFIVNLILYFVTLIIYLLLVIGLNLLSGKISKIKLTSKEIKIKEEKDEN